MTGLPYIIETALLLLVAFLVGCVLGYGLRRLAPERRSGHVAASVPPVSPAEDAAIQISQAPSASLVEGKEAAPMEAAAALARRKRLPTDPRPAALAAPRDGKKDDLKQIKGIGPRIEASLNQLGIFHFDQIARWSKKNVAWVDEYLSFKGRISRGNWIEQAKALSAKPPAGPPVQKRGGSKT